MKFLIRQTYTTASLVAMVPAAVWAVSWYGGGDIVHVIGRFPYVYLFVCQLMIVPRYVAAAWGTLWLAERYKKQFVLAAGIIGFTAVGLILDLCLTYHFARAIADPPPGNHALVLPLLALFYGLAVMLAGAAAGGFGWQYAQRYIKRQG